MVSPNTENSILQVKARRGLAIYFIVLVPLSALFQGLIIAGYFSWVWALMWTPAIASFVARAALHEGFSDVSFYLKGACSWKAIGIAWIFPIIIGLIAYGIAWSTGLVQFSPKLIISRGPSSPLLVFAINLALTASIFTLLSMTRAAGEEIGWRGYMLTRLIDAGVPQPILVSGLIWGAWHVPLVLGGVYLAGSAPILTSLLVIVTATAISFVFARLRLETGSIWPAIVLHGAWNSIIQGAFDTASSGSKATLWVGESGILVAVVLIISAIIFSVWKCNGK